MRRAASTRVLNGEGETLVVCLEATGEPAAYLTYCVAGPGRQGEDPSPIQIVELAGSRWAVLHALPALLERRGLESLELRYAGWDAEIEAAVQGGGWPVKPSGFRGTVGIINPARFWDVCGGLFRERLGEQVFEQLRFSADGAVTFGCGAEELALEDMAAFTRLAFEHPARRHELRLGLDARSELRHVLEALFPLPLVNYGLNYF
jgi:hypothetical protein